MDKNKIRNNIAIFLQDEVIKNIVNLNHVFTSKPKKRIKTLKYPKFNLYKGGNNNDY